MFRDLFSFAVGAIVALISVMPYEKCVNKTRIWVAKISRVAEIEARTGLDVEWIDETHTWTGLQKECAKTAAETCRKMADAGLVHKLHGIEKKPCSKVAKQFEAKDLQNVEHTNPNMFIPGSYQYRMQKAQMDKQTLEKVIDEKNVFHGENHDLYLRENVANNFERLMKHFEDEDVPPSERLRGIYEQDPHLPSVLKIATTSQPVEKCETPSKLGRILDEVAGELDRRMDIVTKLKAEAMETPSKLERILDEAELEFEQTPVALQTNTNDHLQNDQHVDAPTETLAGDS